MTSTLSATFLYSPKFDDLVGAMFSRRRLGTLDIAIRFGVPEHMVYSALSRWRERRREIARASATKGPADGVREDRADRRLSHEFDAEHFGEDRSPSVAAPLRPFSDGREFPEETGAHVHQIDMRGRG
jgi:hypothetical protein